MYIYWIWLEMLLLASYIAVYKMHQWYRDPDTCLVCRKDLMVTLRSAWAGCPGAIIVPRGG